MKIFSIKRNLNESEDDVSFLQKEKKPFPLLLIVTMFCFLFLKVMKLTMVMSFLPEFVKSLGATEVEAGTQAGWIISASAMTSIIFSFAWGYFGDIKGHDMALILCHIGLTVVGLLFGFSTSFYSAFFTRLLQGCFIGVPLATKCIVYAVCDNSSLPQGMAILSAALSIAFVFGPSFSGILVFPDRQYPNIFSKDNIFARFPLLLPCFVIFLGDIFVLLLGLVVIPKHYKRHSYNVLYTIMFEPKSIKVRFNSDCYGFRKPLQISTNKVGDGNESNKNTENNKSAKLSWKEKIANSKLKIVLSDKHCVLGIILYGMDHLVDIGVDILFPLYSSTSRKYHGLGLMPKDIGLVLLVVAIVNIILQFTCFAKIFSFGLIVTAAIYIYLPALRLIQDRYALFFAATLLLLICRCLLSLAYVAANILLNNSVPIECNGLINGIGVSVSSLGRMCVPLIYGNAFSWSLKNIKGIDNVNPLGFPFNEYFAFFILTILGMIIGSIAYFFLPVSYNTKKDSTSTDIEKND